MLSNWRGFEEEEKFEPVQDSRFWAHLSSERRASGATLLRFRYLRRQKSRRKR
jgi:hypothetical protein